jgi:hypothetical protein
VSVREGLGLAPPAASHHRSRSLGTLVLLGALAAACGGPVPSPTATSLTPIAAPTPSPTLPPEIAAAIEVRALYGLKNDEGYVRSVAANPTATTDVLGIPLLPAEVAELRARAKDRARVNSTVEAYGKQHEDTWAGLYLDEAGGGSLVARFTSDLARHEAALRRLVGPFGRLRVELAPRSLAELQAHVDAIEADRGWFSTIDAFLRYASFEAGGEVVVVHVSSADPEVATRITDHFDGEGWLVVESDGVGLWEGGWGDLRILLVDERANRVIPDEEREQFTCSVVPDKPAAWGGGPGIVGPDGVCRFDGRLGATGYDITIEHVAGSGDEVVVGHGRAEVRANDVTEVTIPVTTRSGVTGTRHVAAQPRVIRPCGPTAPCPMLAA